VDNPTSLPHQPPAPQRSMATFRDYWKILRGGMWTILASFTIVVGLVALWTFTQTPIYRSVATVEVRVNSGGRNNMFGGQDNSGIGVSGFGWGAEERYYNTQIEILKSRDLATRVVKRMNLTSDPQFATQRDPAMSVSGMIRALPRTDTGILEISINGTDPKRITDLANAVADEYVQRNIDRAKQNLSDLLREMNGEVAKLSESTRTAEIKKFDEGQTANMLVPEAQSDVLGRQLAQYTEEYTKTQIEVGRLQAVMRGVEGVRAAGGDLLTVKDIADQQSVQSLVSQRSELEREIEGMRVKYLPNHPELQKKTSELETVKSKLTDQIERIVNGYRASLGVNSARASELSSNIERTREQLFEAGKNSTTYSLLSREANMKAKVYEAIQSKLNEIAVTTGLLSNNLNVLDYATVPRNPIRPRKAINLFLGALCGLLAGVGVVFVLDHLNNTVKSLEDIEHGLQLPVLSIIPRYKETTSNAVKEAFQTLKTNVLFSSNARKRNLLLLTSAAPREGKSSTVINLARTIASAGERVIVVDCDLRRPTVHEHLDLERDHGLTNYLTGGPDDSLEQYFKPSSTPNLSVLTCGPIPPNPPELFGGEKFQAMLQELRTRFDWVILDSPPVISLTDSVMLASMVDNVVFVVKHNESDRDMIRRCIQSIRNVNPHVIGAVLNNIDIEKSYSKDYYYQGYYYYSGEDASKKKKKRSRSSEVAAGGTAST